MVLIVKRKVKIIFCEVFPGSLEYFGVKAAIYSHDNLIQPLFIIIEKSHVHMRNSTSQSSIFAYFSNAAPTETAFLPSLDTSIFFTCLAGRRENALRISFRNPFLSVTPPPKTIESTLYFFTTGIKFSAKKSAKSADITAFGFPRIF